MSNTAELELDTLEAAPLVGAQAVQACVERQLALCRRRGTVLSVLHVRVGAITGQGVVLLPQVERRVREEVSHRIAHSVRGSDVLLHQAERELCVILPGADAAITARVARRLSNLLDGDYCVAGQRARATIAIGSAVHPADGTRASELLQRSAQRR